VTLVIPHTPPFLLVDRAPATGVIEKLVSANDPLTTGGLLPDALMLEAMAQACACVAAAGDARGALVTVRQWVRTERAVVAGDRLRLDVREGGRSGRAAIFDVRAEIDGDEVARARLCFDLDGAC
jgi:3-hydroxymyristoyl/3-hydroxydecanoyl-(acyl carrier protein) dehydratase